MPDVQDGVEPFARPALVRPVLPVGELPRRAAGNWPGRLALRLGDRALTFAELDREVDRVAGALRRQAGDEPVTIAAATVLTPDFAALYYGIARSGHVIVSLNPLVREAGLRHVLAVSQARVAVVTAEMYQRVNLIRADLPDLRTLVVLDPDGTPLREGDLEWRQLLDSAPAPLPGPAAQDLDATACLHFTSGTSGAPKAVRLSHRNLTVNAAQTAQAQGLNDTSVTLNNLPLFHLMHLNSALWAGASQVLHPWDDAADTIAAANTAAATHFFGLPVRLARLAADPRLPDLALRTVQGIFSGGSAMPPKAATVLARHFGIPVVQGYGLAEASPTVTLDVPAGPTTGSCGPVVADTECRVVDITTRRPLPAGAKGEIQVRGPQLMKGYLGEPDGASFDADGWFSTGDVGRFDERGALFVVDRLSDVFKRDNEIVAPAEIEQVLARHPAVADCAVFGHPDEFSGALPHALVVLREGVPGTTAAEITAFVNERVAPFQQLGYLDTVDAVPRSPQGKIQRRQLRERFCGPVGV